MPTYDYLCENGHRFEEHQRITDDALEKCVVCGAPVRRMLHAPAIHFKGSGFYSTDYGSRKRGPNGNGQESKSESSTSSGEKSGGSSSETSKTSSGGETSSTTKTASSDS